MWRNAKVAIALLVVATSQRLVAAQDVPNPFEDLGRKVEALLIAYPSDAAKVMPPIHGVPDLKEGLYGAEGDWKFADLDLIYLAIFPPAAARAAPVQEGGLQMPDVNLMGHDYLLLARLREGADFSKVLSIATNRGDTVKIAGAEQYKFSASIIPGEPPRTQMIHILNARTLLMGSESLVTEVLAKAGRAEKAVDVVQGFPRKHHLSFDATGTVARYSGVVAWNKLDLGFGWLLFTHGTRRSRLNLDLSTGGVSDFVLDLDAEMFLAAQLPDQKITEVLELAISKARKELLNVAIEFSNPPFSLGGKAVSNQEAMEACFAQWKPKVENRQVIVHIEISKLPTFLGRHVLYPPLDGMKELRRKELRNQVAQAIFQFESKHGKLPSYASVDANGQPLLSWRVHLLPFLGHEELHKKFHLNEPWNSPHNKRLLAEIPVMYQDLENPLIEKKVKGKQVMVQNTRTRLALPIGSGSAFNPKSRKTSDAVTDPKGQTILLLEAVGKPVEWTKPEDLAIDSPSLVEDIFGKSDEQIVVMWNLEQKPIHRRLTLDQLKVLLTIDGSEEFSLAQ